MIFLEFESSVRSSILDILCSSFPRFLKFIYENIRKEHDITYQGVYKALKELERQKLFLRIITKSTF